MAIRMVLFLALAACPAFAFSQDTAGAMRAIMNQMKDPTTAQGFVDRAAERTKSGDFDGAIADLTRAMALDPANPQTVNSRGVAKWRKKDFDGAIADFTKAIEMDPKFAMAYFNRGVNREDKGDLDGAIPDYTKAVELAPSKAPFSERLQTANAKKEIAKRKEADPSAAAQIDAAEKLLVSALAKWDKLDFDAVVPDLNQAILLDPANIRAYTLRGTFLMMEGKTLEAKGEPMKAKETLAASIADFTKVIELKPGEAWGWAGRARSELAAGDYVAAQEDFAKANSIDPSDATTKSIAGEISKKMSDPGVASNVYAKSADKKFDRSDYDGAIADATRAIQANPVFSLSYGIRGASYAAKKQYDLALTDLNRFIQMEPNVGMGYLSRGNLYLDRGDYDLALADYNSAISMDPNDPETAEAYSNRAAIYQDNGNKAGAVADYTKAIELGAKDADIYYNRAKANYDLRDYSAAIADYDQAIRLSPTDSGSYTGRGDAYLDSGNAEKALADYTKALQLKPNSARAIRGRGAAAVKRGDFETAIADLAKAIAADPKNIAAYKFRATAYYQKGSFDLGIADYTAAAALDKKQIGIPVYRAWGYLAWNKPDLAYEQAITFLELNGMKGDDAPYAVIIGYIALRKSGRAPAATAFLDRWIALMKPDTWTTDIAHHLRGDLPSETLLARADNDGKLTEAHTYIGVMQWFAGTPNLTKIHYGWVKDNGAKDYFEYTFVNAEFGRLGVAPPKTGSVPPTKVTAVTGAKKTAVTAVAKPRATANSKIAQAQALYKSGLAKQKENDRTGAAADFTKAIELDPGLAEAYLQRGRLWDGGDKDLADFNKAIALNPRLAQAYYERATWLAEYSSEDYEKGLNLQLADLNKAIELNPKYALAYGARGFIRSLEQTSLVDLKGAIADYTNAIRFEPDNYSWYEGRAICYRAKGQNALADADDKKAQALKEKLDK